MTDPIAIVEILLRGAASGLSLLLAITLASGSNPGRTRLLGALFCFSTSVYALLASPMIRVIFGPAVVAVSFIAVVGPIFFWWFASSFFDDNFKWRAWRIAPIVVLPLMHIGHISLSSGLEETLFWYAHIGLNVVLYLDVVRLALVNANEDLVNRRRVFRFAIAIAVAITGIGIAIGETYERGAHLPDSLLLIHAVSVFALLVFFGVWMIKPRRELFEVLAGPASDGGGKVETNGAISAADRGAYETLTRLMDEGAYREEGLTVPRLAEKVGLAEHQLRRLINQQLGFRNFSAFLNARRIDDAKALLGDPANARKQVLQIALDLGYGSITPFNRAFKQATDMTPTEFRKKALGED